MAQSSGAAKSHMNGRQDMKKAVGAKPIANKHSSASTRISTELHKLCKSLDEPNGNSKDLYRFASEYITKNLKSRSSCLDSLYIYENVRRIFEQQRGQGDGPSFDDLYRIYKQQTTIKNTDAPLELILHLSEDARRPLIPPLSNVGLSIAAPPSGGGARTEAPPPPGAAVSQADAVPAPESRLAPRQCARKTSATNSALIVSQSAGTMVARPQITFYEGQAEVPEWLLIRDLIYSFQGINGKHLKYDAITQGYIIDQKANVRPYMRRMCLRLAELSWFHMQVRQTCEGWARSKSAGLVHQCLTSVMRKELTEYYRVVAVFSTKSNMSSREQESAPSMVALPSSEDLRGITLCRLSVWTKHD